MIESLKILAVDSWLSDVLHTTAGDLPTNVLIMTLQGEVSVYFY